MGANGVAYPKSFSGRMSLEPSNNLVERPPNYRNSIAAQLDSRHHSTVVGVRDRHNSPQPHGMSNATFVGKHDEPAKPLANLKLTHGTPQDDENAS